jgi:hypothetical protein
VNLNIFFVKFQELKSNLQKTGYSHQWKLIKQKDIISNSKEESSNHVDFYDKIAKQTTKPLVKLMLHISQNYVLIQSIVSKYRFDYTLKK